MPHLFAINKSTRSTPLLIGLLILFLAALIFGGVYMELLGQRAYNSAQRAGNLLLRERDIYSLLIDMETGTRGYIITGDEQFLQPYTDAQSKLPDLWARLSAEITALDGSNASSGDELEQAAAQLKKNADTWQSQWAAPQIELRRRGLAQEVTSNAASERGKQMLDAFRESSRKLNTLANERLHGYNNDLNNIRETELGLIIVVGLLAVGSAVLTLRVSRRESQLQEDGTRRIDAERKRLQAFLENLPVAARLVDVPNGNVILQNRLSDEIFPAQIWNRLSRQERIDYFNMKKPDGTPLLPEDTPVPRMLKENVPAPDVEFMSRAPGGNLCHLSASVAPVKDEHGNINSAVIIIQDITRMRELDQRKDEFIATAAHELRNPLAALSGYAQLVQRQLARDAGAGDKATIERHVGEIGKQVNRLNALVERLLDASRVQLGKLILDKTRQDLVKITQTVVSDLQAPGDGAREHEVTISAPPQLIGCWDGTRLEQVITNLLGNALRHTPPNSHIEIRIAEQNGQARVQVVDDGPGIPDQDRTLLFNRYYQTASIPQGSASEGAPTRKKQGLGLGLYISNEIIRAHNGQIGVDPSAQGGSIFWFSIPIGECS